LNYYEIEIPIYSTFILNSLYAQRAAIWYGESAGLDFNSESNTLTDGKLTTNEGCATISDKDGNYFFYTDGSFVYNKNHKIM
jgi:hypothetical protein